MCEYICNEIKSIGWKKKGEKERRGERERERTSQSRSYCSNIGLSTFDKYLPGGLAKKKVPRIHTLFYSTKLYSYSSSPNQN